MTKPTVSKGRIMGLAAYRKLFFATVIAALTLTACGGADEASNDPNSPRNLRPADPKLATIYERNCLGCHSRPNGNAPTTGDATEWAPRIAKGMHVLLENTQNGYRAMPRMGGCPDCSEDTFVEIIEFMATDPVAAAAASAIQESQSEPQEPADSGLQTPASDNGPL